MNIYASSYISGLQQSIATWLKEIYKDVDIVKHLDGLIIYKTNEKLINTPFFNNSFLCLHMSEVSISNLDETNTLNNIKGFVNNLNIDFDSLNSHINKNFKTFKILAFNKNQPAKINFNDISQLENKITNNTTLRLGKEHHDAEFHIVSRSENLSLLLYKLTYNRKTEKEINKGSLRPELAYSLCKLADIKDTDICFDMFCGSGSIPKTIVKYFKYNMVFASDIDENKTNSLKQEFKNNNKRLYVKQRNAKDLSYFEDGFIDKIITDPPWNIFQTTGESFKHEYVQYLNEMSRILKPTGKCVILMGNIKDFEDALKQIDMLKIIERYNILVNGKKANIYLLQK